MKDTNIIIKAAALVTLSLSALPCVAGATTPSVTVIQPTSNVADVMEITVKATDPDGITKVKLYIDGVQLAGDTKAPYNFTWDSYSYKGRDVKIKALAIDTKNSKGTDEIIFAVPKSNTSNPSPPDEETPDTGTQPSKGKTEILFTGDFETGAIQARPEDHDGWSEQSGGLAKGIVVQSAIKRAGKYAAKSTLNKGDWDGTNTIQGKTKPRAKLAKSNAYVPFQFDNEYWIGISTYIPKNWVNETNINNVEV
ncbi:MAG: Ig-like domain-containing protein, partial [Halioglobus sp.]